MIHHTTVDGNPYPVEDCPIFHSMQKHAMQRAGEDLFWRKNGTWFAVEYQSVPLLQGKRIQGVVVVFKDITEVGTNRSAVSGTHVPELASTWRTKCEAGQTASQ